MNTNTEQRIYVACLASYNNGILHGEWIDATSDSDEMQEEVNRILRTSPEPNVFVTCPDCDGAGEGGNCESDGGKCRTCAGTGQVPSAEEWAIHDHEGLGDLGEYSGLAEVARRVHVADVAEERGLPVAVVLEAMSDEYEDDAERFLEDHYAGSADTWSDYAEDFHTEVGDLESVPEWLRHHIDWDSVGQEMRHEYNSVEHNGTLYVFYQ